MNRSNVGNIVANGMQIASVAATTAAGAKRVWDKEDASAQLNNEITDVDDILAGGVDTDSTQSRSTPFQTKQNKAINEKISRDNKWLKWMTKNDVYEGIEHTASLNREAFPEVAAIEDLPPFMKEGYKGVK